MNISQINSSHDTIAAIATPAGVGGIGIVRLSGPQALEIADKIFRAASRRKLADVATHTVHFGKICDEKAEVLDDVLATVMRAPRTYTGEDVVEVSGHGGDVVLKAILDLLLRSGARLAEPGEFTRRAFLNGRMDLIQAEAVLDIIQAKTESALRVGTQQLEGDLSREMAFLREQFLSLYASLEAGINFPEEGLETVDGKEFSDALDQMRSRVGDLMASADAGRILREGVRVVICGRANVGKSSLLNALLREPRAIVSSIAGTTRDTIEETIQVKGLSLSLVDTAGILSARDEIETEALRRSQAFIKNADLVLFLLDASQPLSREDEGIRCLITGQPTVIVLNKSDLPEQLTGHALRDFLPGKERVRVSAFAHTGLEELKNTIVDEVLHGKPMDTHRVMVTNLRHKECLRDCEQALERAQEGLTKRISIEFVSEEIKSAIQAVDRLTGRDLDEDLLDQIFSNFCIGK